ncbi:MAG TPA: hypothetical protein VHN99_02015 [Deinococcales bacterium]|nr:hypothetical protein [Deinococcales bacterium]
MPTPENARKGQVTASDETLPEHRDAARRRLELAMNELSERMQPRNIVRNNPVAVAAGAGVIGLLVARKIFVRPRRQIVYQQVPAGTAVAVQPAPAAGGPSLRRMIVGTLTGVVLTVLRERLLEPTLKNALTPNLEKMADSAADRLRRRGEKKK